MGKDASGDEKQDTRRHEELVNREVFDAEGNFGRSYLLLVL